MFIIKSLKNNFCSVKKLCQNKSDFWRKKADSRTQNITPDKFIICPSLRNWCFPGSVPFWVLSILEKKSSTLDLLAPANIISGAQQTQMELQFKAINCRSKRVYTHLYKETSWFSTSGFVLGSTKEVREEAVSKFLAEKFQNGNVEIVLKPVSQFENNYRNISRILDRKQGCSCVQVKPKKWPSYLLKGYFFEKAVNDALKVVDLVCYMPQFWKLIFDISLYCTVKRTLHNVMETEIVVFSWQKRISLNSIAKECLSWFPGNPEK